MLKKLILALVIVFLSVPMIFAQENSSLSVGDKPILFVRQGCPHCAKVDAFMTEHNLSSQVERKETLNNQTNLDLMDEWFNHFSVAQNQRGVPFLVVDSDTYYAGDTPIIQYLADQNDIEVKPEEYESSMSDTLILGLGGVFLAAVLGYGIYSMFKKK